MSSDALLLDYLFVGQLLQARVSDQVAELASQGGVHGIKQYAEAMERQISAPTAFVLWEGDQFGTAEGERAAFGSAQIVRQIWSVNLAVRNADQYVLDAVNTSAGPLLSSIHKAVAGWTPPGAFRPLRRAPGRRVVYTPNVGIYPLTFELSLHL